MHEWKSVNNACLFFRVLSTVARDAIWIDNWIFPLLFRLQVQELFDPERLWKFFLFTKITKVQSMWMCLHVFHLSQSQVIWLANREHVKNIDFLLNEQIKQHTCSQHTTAKRNREIERERHREESQKKRDNVHIEILQ